MVNEFNFSKSETTIIKGIAITLMLIHHLFGFPNRILETNEYISLNILDSNLAYYTGVFGRICVAIYLFLSGYGLFNKYSKQKNYCWIIEKIKNFIVNYWVVIIFIFIPLSVIFEDFKINLKELIYNMSCIKISYIGSWWFVRVYLELLIIFPLIIKLIDKNIISSIIKAIILPIIITIVRQRMNFTNISIINLIFEMITYLPLFMSGAIFAKFNIFNRINILFNKYKLNNILFNFSVIILIFIIRTIKPYIFYLDLIYVPVFIFSIINLANINKFIMINNIIYFLGKNSTNFWLIHDILLSGHLQKLIYFPKISVLILIWLVLILTPISWVVNKIIKYISLIKSILKNKILIKV